MFIRNNIGALLACVGGIAGLIGIIANISQIIEFVSSKWKHFFPNKKKEKKLKKINKTVPNNLPTSNNFIGRKQVIQDLCKSIDTNILTTVIGQGGVGKSSLVLDTVKKYYLFGKTPSNKHHTFDAVVWLSSKDYIINLETALDTIARVLDYTGVIQIDNITQKRAEIDTLLRKYNVLLIFDNFETVSDNEIYSFIENICDNSRVVITSRVRKDWNISYFPIYLVSLSIEDGISLIKHEYDRLNVSYAKEDEKDLFVALFYATGGVPLAIKWAIGQSNTRGIPLEKVINFLQVGQGDIFANMFERGWSSISENEKRILYSLLFFVSPANRNGLFAASGCSEEEFDDGLGELIGLSFVETNNNPLTHNQLFSVHPLTRSFVKKHFNANDAIDDEINNHLLDYYLKFCKNHYQINEAKKDYDALEFEILNIFKFIEWAYSSPKFVSKEKICLMADYLSVFLWSRGYWSKRIDIANMAAEISDKTRDYFTQIKHLYYIGIVKFWQGNISEAKKYYDECRTIAKNYNNATTNALIKRLFALINMSGESWIRSITYFTCVLDALNNEILIPRSEVALFADWYVNGPEGYKAGNVAVMQEIGITYNRHKEYEKAIEWLNKSLALAEKINDVEGQSVSLSHLGFSYMGQKKYIDAEKVCKKGLEYAISVQRKSTTARCYQVLAEVMHIRKRKGKEKEYAQEAIVLFDKLGMTSELDEIKTMLDNPS